MACRSRFVGFLPTVPPTAVRSRCDAIPRAVPLIGRWDRGTLGKDSGALLAAQVRRPRPVAEVDLPAAGARAGRTYPASGPVILASNHLSFSDSIFMPLMVDAG